MPIGFLSSSKVEKDRVKCNNFYGCYGNRGWTEAVELINLLSLGGNGLPEMSESYRSLVKQILREYPQGDRVPYCASLSCYI